MSTHIKMKKLNRKNVGLEEKLPIKTVLPSLLEFANIHKKVPTNLTFAFASLMRFYIGTFNGEKLPVNDNEDIVANFAEIWMSNNYIEITKKVLSIEAYWGEDLIKVENLTDAVA